MNKQKILGTIMLVMPLLMVGCGKDEVQEQHVEQVESVNQKENNDKKEIDIMSLISNKQEYKDIKVKVPDSLEKVEDTEELLLYVINDTKRTVGISSDYIESRDLNDYMEDVKSTLSKTIDLSNSKSVDEQIGGFEVKTLEYDYKLEGNVHKVYQKCFKHNKLVYVFTLCSTEEHINTDRELMNDLVKSACE